MFDSVTPWAVAGKAPVSVEFSRQGYWSGLPFPFPGDLPNYFFLQGVSLTQGSKPGLLHCRQILYSLSHQGSPDQVLRAIKRSVTLKLGSISQVVLHSCTPTALTSDPFKGYLGLSGDIFDCYNWGRGRCAIMSSGSRPGMLFNFLECTST